MDQSSNGVVLLSEGDVPNGHEPTYGQLKQMLPECFVSVKLETYEDHGTSERSIESTLRTGCCNQPANNCNCSTPKGNCVVITPTSSAPFTCQFLPAAASANMLSEAPEPEEAPPPPPSPAHSRTSSSHTFAAARTSEVPWLAHHVEPVISSQSSHFQHHPMHYFTTDGTVVTQAAGERIMIKQANSSPGGRGENANIISTISGLSGMEACDPNTLINYVLSQQRSGAAAGSIFLSFEPPRAVASHVVQHSPRDEIRGTSNNSSANLKLERSDVGSPSSNVRVESGDSAVAASSPNPGEVVGNQVSRYCQTVPITPQQQDAKTSTEELEEELEEINGTGFVLKQGLKHITFGHIRTAVAEGPHNSVDAPDGRGGGAGVGGHVTTELMKQLALHRDVHKTEPTDNKLANKLLIPTFTGLDPGDKPFRCKICGRNYQTEQALLNHDRYHRGDRPYECETCHKAFATNSHLVTHRRTHTGERPFQCLVCNRSFADRSAYMKHERTHGPGGTIIKRYKCDQCGNGFVDSCGLKKHTRIHTGERPYICSVCSKAFSTSSTFVAHKRIHTGERPYKCESCEKMFVTKSHLLTHRRKHTGEKPFTCAVCNRCFADGSSFRRHERLHTGEQRHICDLCGRGFPSEPSLERHRQGHLVASAIAPAINYMYENRDTVNNLTRQEQEHRVCDVQSTHCVMPQSMPVDSDHLRRESISVESDMRREPIPVDSDHSNVGVDLSQEMAA